MSLKKQTIDLGTFELVSTVARISDPCYNKDTWCAGTIKDVHTGTWEAQVIKLEKTSPNEYKPGTLYTDHRNILVARLKSFPLNDSTTKKQLAISGGMDAGLAGIFDGEMYQVDYTEDYAQVGEVEYHNANDEWRSENALKEYEAFAAAAENEEIRKYYENLIETKKSSNKKPTIDYSKAEVTRDWYKICCDKSLSSIGAGVIRNGVVSSSGYGDGSYRVFAAYNTKGQVVGIKLVF